MIEAIKLWNEPNNLSHWDFQMDPEWSAYAEMTIGAARRIRAASPGLTIVMGGISPIDPLFMQRMRDAGVLDAIDAVAVHGFPLDWNHWKIDEWPAKLDEIRTVTEKPVWVTEVGVSTFGAEEVQVFGLQRTQELLIGRAERVYWYSLLDLPAAWGATTRHQESEGSSYYRHFHMGLLREDGTPKPSVAHFDPRMGICQWFHHNDARLDFAIEWLRRLGVTRLRTGLSWGDWHREDGRVWLDHMMDRLQEFELTVTLCFTPPSRGRRPDHTSPPLVLEEFGEFAEAMVDRYVLGARPAA